MKESQKTLLEVERSSGHTLSYLKDQWNRQRQMQLGEMENETELQMKKQVEELVMLEDQLQATQSVEFFVICWA
jgi:hypothetical protein